MVLEIDLHHFIRQSKHNSMACTHPFLHIHYVSDLSLRLFRHFLRLIIRFRFGRTFKIRAEMLQKRNFFLQSGGVVHHCVPFTHVLAIALPPLNVVEVVRVGVEHDLSRVVEENTD